MWVVQVCNRINGVKNLLCGERKKENGEYSCWQSCHHLLCGSQPELQGEEASWSTSHLPEACGMAGDRQGWGLAAWAHFGPGSQGSHLVQRACEWLGEFRGNFQTVSAISCCSEGAESPRGCNPSFSQSWAVPWIAGAVLHCHLWGECHLHPAASYISGMGDSCHLSLAALPFSVHRQSCVQMSGGNTSPAPSLSCSTLLRAGTAHTWSYCLLPNPLSNS